MLLWSKADNVHFHNLKPILAYSIRNGRKMSFKNDNIKFLSNFLEDSYIIYGNLSREQDSRF